MAVRSGSDGIVDAVKIDLKRLHDTWMEVIFPRQLNAERSVLGRWTPNSSSGWAAYRLWGAVGALFVLIAYPLAVAGFATRYYAGKLDSTVTRLGIFGVVLVTALVWGGLSVLARYQLSFDGFVAVTAAAAIATVCAALAALFTVVGGRTTTVVFAYPFAVTALFLPPVVAALYSPSVAAVVFPNSETLAIWILDNVLAVGRLNDILRARFELAGAGLVGMWVGISVPVGWFLGLLTTLASLVRPRNG